MNRNEVLDHVLAVLKTASNLLKAVLCAMVNLGLYAVRYMLVLGEYSYPHGTWKSGRAIWQRMSSEVYVHGGRGRERGGGEKRD